ncbi:differentially expressed in FDCP 8 homolog isoform X1 [Mytilus edulis]|uniref:differentially expressed in FDCP 8 homolog isoform X1 n=2 Tax=Mytilus edulis TaxID=6550 RepID=UPI0039EFA3BA
MNVSGEQFSAKVRTLSDLPGASKETTIDNTGTAGIIHRIENNTASIKFTGTVITGLSDEEISSEEEQDYSFREIGPVDEETLKKINEKFVPEHDDDIVKLEIDLKKRGLSDASKEDSIEKTTKIDKGESPSTFSQSRFNPFDRDLHMEEDHFEINNSRPRSGSFSSWTNLSETGDEITINAELGLAEDHFSHPEGHFGLSNHEELEMAIENCKEMISEAQPHSDRMKNLVQKLIQLRLKLQELKEGPEPVSSDIKIVLGHKFTIQDSRNAKHYCEKCNAMILGVIQTWLRCADCGYSCHEKCVNGIKRTCASLKVAENGIFCLSICPDRGLSAQNYRCAECRSHISFKSGFSEPRLCDYSGNYYCELCHWNDTMVIPSRVLHNWDFEPHKVCRASKQFLKLMTDKAVMRIQDVNPMLFNYVEELSEVKKLREELLIMKKYLLLCKNAMSEKFLLMLKGRQHFVENSDVYSMQDFLDIQSDKLLGDLATIHSAWAQHIKTDCELCRARGFICELCKDHTETLFPFDSVAIVCSQCSYVLHRHCFIKKGSQCPRCERKNKRKAT